MKQRVSLLNGSAIRSAYAFVALLTTSSVALAQAQEHAFMGQYDAHLTCLLCEVCAAREDVENEMIDFQPLCENGFASEPRPDPKKPPEKPATGISLVENEVGILTLASRLRFVVYREYTDQVAMVMSPTVTIPPQAPITLPVVEISSIGVYSWLPENNLPAFVISTASMDVFHQRNPHHRKHAMHCVEGGGEDWCTNMTGHESGIGLSTLWQNHDELDLVIVHGYANWHAFRHGPHTVTALGGMRFKRTHELHPFEVGARYGVTVGDAEVSTEASVRVGGDGGEQHFQPSIACSTPIGPLVADAGFQLQVPVNQEEETGAKLLLGLLWNGRTRRTASQSGRYVH